jgi:hypothetical protein
LTKRPNTIVNKKKNKRKKKNNVAIPLVKGLSASSLVRENAIKAASSTSSNKKQKKSNNNSNNNNKTSLFKSIADSQAVISEYHTLNKRLEQNENDTSITDEQRKRNADNIRKQQEEMGGLNRYQKASIFGAKSSKFVCADWVVPFLLEDGTKKPKRQEQKQKQKKDPTGQQKLEEEVEEEDSLCDEKKTRQQRRNIRILDVGAIDNQYKKYDNWLDAVPIDLHGGQHESVLQVDFFDYAHEYCLKNDLAAATSASSTATTSTATNNDEYDNKGKRRRHKLLSSSSSSSSSSVPPPQPFDAIVMSLVLNFQGDPRKRGDMIALAADPRLLRSDTKGMLFVALPSASLDNSRYCDINRFVNVCKTLGFALVEKKKSLKLILLAFRRASDSNDDDKDDKDDNFDAKGRPTHHHYYSTKTRSFDYGKQEMKRLPAKPGAKRNNFSVILKSTVNRDK